jgi:myo-inositol-1(or 4)-monophosphatase
MKSKELKQLLLIAVDIAKGASDLLLSGSTHYRKTRHDFCRDVKIEADFVADRYIINELSRQTRYPILSEESGQIENARGKSSFRWIVDPLDGSINFLRGIPICCISIALWDGIEPLLGVVYDFNRDEMFCAMVGEGAWLNNKPIMVSKVDEKSNAILCTGFPVSTDFSKEKLSNFINNIREFKKVRLLGSAAISLCYVACGRVDYYQENDIKIWDVAAGIPLVKAAGGIVKIEQITANHTTNVEAANEFLIKSFYGH